MQSAEPTSTIEEFRHRRSTSGRRPGQGPSPFPTSLLSSESRPSTNKSFVKLCIFQPFEQHRRGTIHCRVLVHFQNNDILTNHLISYFDHLPVIINELPISKGALIAIEFFRTFDDQPEPLHCEGLVYIPFWLLHIIASKRLHISPPRNLNSIIWDHSFDFVTLEVPLSLCHECLIHKDDAEQQLVAIAQKIEAGYAYNESPIARLSINACHPITMPSVSPLSVTSLRCSRRSDSLLPHSPKCTQAQRHFETHLTAFKDRRIDSSSDHLSFIQCHKKRRIARQALDADQEHCDGLNCSKIDQSRESKSEKCTSSISRATLPGLDDCRKEKLVRDLAKPNVSTPRDKHVIRRIFSRSIRRLPKIRRHSNHNTSIQPARQIGTSLLNQGPSDSQLEYAACKREKLGVKREDEKQVVPCHRRFVLMAVLTCHSFCPLSPLVTFLYRLVQTIIEICFVEGCMLLGI